VGDEQRPVYGTAEMTTPVTRADFERAIRNLHISDLEMRDAFLKLAAHVVTLTDELTRRIDKVEPAPAPPGTPAPEPTHTIEEMVAALVGETLDKIRIQDVIGPQRVMIDEGPNKRDVEPAPVPCHEIIPICKARCCTFSFSLSPQDLDEGVIRWDYGQPYLIRQRASDGYCVHNHPTERGCTVHADRPRVCRIYDCRDDKRIWADFDNKILAPIIQLGPRDKPWKVDETDHFNLLERVKRRRAAVRSETLSMTRTFAEHEPKEGPHVEPFPPKPLF
jgi:hypothetical protein